MRDAFFVYWSTRWKSVKCLGKRNAGKLRCAHLWVTDVSRKLTVKTTLKYDFVLKYICEWYGCRYSQSPKTLRGNQKGSSRVYFDYRKENVPWPTLLAERAGGRIQHTEGVRTLTFSARVFTGCFLNKLVCQETDREYRNLMTSVIEVLKMTRIQLRYLYWLQVLVQNIVIFAPSEIEPLVSRDRKTKPAQQIRIHWVQLIVLLL